MRDTMKNYLLVLSISLFLLSCSTSVSSNQASAIPESASILTEAVPIGTITPSTKMVTPSPIGVEEMHIPESALAKDGFIIRTFKDEWERVHKMRSSCIDFDDKNQIWSVFLELEYFDGNKWNTISTPDEFDKTWNCPYVDEDGIIWFFNPSTRRYATSIFSFDGKNWTLFDYPEFLTEDMRSKASMAMDKSSGYIWLGLLNCGEHSCLYYFDGTQWREEPFPFPSIYSLSADKRGNLWIGGNSDTGVAHFDGEEWTFYATKELWPDGIYGWNAKIEWIDVKSDIDGSAWVILGVNDWVKISNDRKIERYPNKFPIETTYNLNIFPVDRGKIWFIWNTMELGYFDYIKNQWGSYANLPSDNLMAGPTFLLSPNGDLWLVLPNNSNGEAGLYKYVPAKE